MINKFSSNIINIIISPVYIIRSRLYISIKKFAPSFYGSILDIGCGSKPYEDLFLNTKKYIGVDIEVSGHDHTSSKVDIFYNGEILPFGDESFDNIVCVEVLEHVFNFNQLIREMHRVLRPGGKLLITVPFAFPEHEPPYDFFRYTSFGLNKLFETNNFALNESIKSTSFFLSTVQLFNIYIFQISYNSFFKIISQLFIIFPITLISVLIDRFLPNNKNYYSNLISIYIKQ